MNNGQRPILGISVGDPAGIGPEITAKALAEKHIYDICRPLVVCDLRIMEEAVEFSKLDLKIRAVSKPSEGLYEFGTMDVLDMHNVDMATFQYKKVAAMTGKASYEYIEKVIQLALAKEIDATITGPIHKEAINAAGIHEAGHTEIYARLTGTKDYAMMLAEGDFRVVHVSTHVSLQEAINRAKKERVHKVICLADEALKKMGIPNPRIAVAGLNPHAGENGMFGQEEIKEIIPAIEQARAEGKTVEGPIPPDTVFSKMKGGQYDIVVVMYHDQGHIPTKLAGFNYDRATNTWLSMSGVNITLGLPIIRSSVDHGVAFGKAGEGRANPESMLQAIEMGVRMV
ncbi:MAG: 4-hydroxythreonine-4-phosphate dehydrogenase PdxA [Spirochaetae bacterium HGW-Spirochaetae-4]|nr:MAG: 4-hydroxythreonine-4-phosphate dehydrogenase PdxA [Spirochaetes bacterium GWC2_52_13]PKL20203.1 MAG: 4-hydroxythreonine-4-phosphate dehydrogenase PdxA [Spirochaetae bacterium HGW-Spirochaetae-4]HCG64548.1 4-hydroxythreonine-4-phosphate dehydrogenase PdxA [Sphaerochaeta sp.]HCS36422.1 4-hydroxythreonine-4-phosphate dehydrogenase PdxA [Sphaerochaeta sp.]